MDEFITALAKLGALASMRADDAVARQAVMNHGTTAHFMDMSFVRDAFEVSVVEGHAMQGLAASTLAAQASGYQLADRVPVVKAAA